MDVLQPESWPRPPGFSNGTVAEGRHVFVAGQVGSDQMSGQMAESFAGRALGDAWKVTMGRNFPAITLVEVTGLLAEGAMVEIEAHAVIRG